MYSVDFSHTNVTFLPSVRVKGEVSQTATLEELLLSGAWKESVERVRNEPDSARRAALKKELPCFTPSGEFRGNGDEYLVRHSGFICIDIDAKDNKDVANFADFKKLVCQIPHVAYCGYSVGGVGYFCMIPIACPARHKEHFRALEADFARCGLTVDSHCSNVCAKRFVSYDPEPYLNLNAQVYDRLLSDKSCEGASDRQSRWPSVRTRLPVFHSSDNAEQKFLEALKRIEFYGVDITKTNRRWFEILCAISNTYGEQGRGYAHAVSQYYPGYSQAETDREYTHCLRHGYKYTMGTFYHYYEEEMRDRGLMCGDEAF